MKNALVVLSLFISGILCGYFDLIPSEISAASTYVLYVLLFAAGMIMGFDLRAWGIIRELKLKIFALPLGIVLGSLVGGIIASLLFIDLSALEGMTVASSLGWYSLSSVMITNSGYPALGSITLVANMLREIICLAFAPLLVRFFGKVSPIATCGAASMDTCLPLIVKYSGESYAILAVFTGVCLTFVMPILLPVFLTLIIG